MRGVVDNKLIGRITTRNTAKELLTAMDFGVISPKIKRKMVMTAVATPNPTPPNQKYENVARENRRKIVDEIIAH